MTTVAIKKYIKKYKDRIELASDSLGNDNGVGHPRNINSERELYNYFHTIKEKFQTDGNDTEVFLVIFNNKIYDLRLNKSSVDYMEIQGSFYSIGSGRQFALAAMEYGKSPREVVEVAIKYDIYSGGEIQEEIVKF